MIAVSENTYKGLEEQIDESKMVPWKIRSNLLVHPIINELFDFNRFFQHVLFDRDFDILKNVSKKRNGEFEIGEIPSGYFDHYYAVEFKDTYDIGIPEIIGGVMNFPYIYDEQIVEFITKAPVGWEVYIINPVLMNYGTIGLFLTPEYINGAYISELNNFITLKTGYPLFLKYVPDNPNIEPINYTKVDSSVDDFIERFNFKSNKGLDIMLQFWKENDCVSCDSFDYSYKNYCNNQSFSIYKNINFKVIESTTPFKITLTESSLVLGGFKKFHLDCAYMLADTDSEQLLLWDEEMQALIDGDYTIELIDESEYNTLQKLMKERNNERKEKHTELYLHTCITGHKEIDPLRPNKVQY